MDLLKDEVVLRQVAQIQAAYPDISKELLGDLLCGLPLRAYAAFTYGQIGADLSAPNVLYNRYYWFLRFACLHREKYGFDAGIEQQAFQILEYAQCDLDPEDLQRIERKVKDT